jgi:BirA family biotin operon repressor/biotin-[acetyl-CoA-carboxylase] ligase
MREVPSTQDVALQLGDGGAPEGTVVVAQIQTAGRGRSGRAWASPSGGLYMSIILRPETLAQPQLLSLVGALAVVRGIKSSTGIDSEIRWPNDVLILGKKVSGVVVEASYSAQKLSFAVLGVGLNCNIELSTLGSSVGGATSLLEELGRRVDVAKVRQDILDSLQAIYTSWLDGADIIRESEDSVGTLGRQVLVKSKSGIELSCTALELDDYGGLVVLSEGERIVLRGEDIEFLTEIGQAGPKRPETQTLNKGRKK